MTLTQSPLSNSYSRSHLGTAHFFLRYKPTVLTCKLDASSFSQLDLPESQYLTTPTPCQLVDFLQVVRKGLRREGEKKGVGTSTNWVRAIRSHISTTCTLWMNFAVGAHPLVTSYITSIQNEDFFELKKKGYRYDDTWVTEPF